MELTKYHKIYTDLVHYGFTEHQHKIINKETFIALEKIDGANFSIYINGSGSGSGSGSEIFFASRNRILANTDDFFKYHEIKNNLELYSKNVFLKINRPIIIYGELIGPHINKRIFYSNNINYIVYDIFLIDEKKFVSRNNFELYMYKSGFNVLPILYSGYMHEITSRDTKFNSTIPLLLKEQCQSTENMCEGIVIKPETDLMFDGIRPIIKTINSQFKDINCFKLKNNSPHKRHVREIFNYLINDNRIHNVMSKYDNINAEELVDAVADDIISDLYQFPDINMSGNYDDHIKFLKDKIKIFIDKLEIKLTFN